MKSSEERKKATDTLLFAPGLRDNPQLPEQESQHCIKVMRMKEGDRIDVTDGKGYVYECVIVQPHPKKCIVAILSEIHRPKSWHFNLQVAFAPTKSNDRTEWFVEKATEIGIDRFTPISCRYSERKELKTDRLQRVAVSAMKQSQQALLPITDGMTAFEKFIEQPFDGRKFIAHCHRGEKESLSNLYERGENALIIIGPEGDFSEEEVQHAIEKGFEPVTLGENRLRTETASLVACHTFHVLNA